MADRKFWKQQEDQLIMSLVQKHSKIGEQKLKWSVIAKQMNSLMPDCSKTGKQYRERWFNQLNPEINRSKDWTIEQQNTLFSLHDQYGNKWSLISSKLSGRTDNCVKNHFYSAIRKGLRRLNKYISKNKRKENFLKQFKQIVLNKLLAVADKHYEDKLEVKNPAIFLSNTIKNQLIQLSKENQQLDDSNQINIQLKQQIIANLQQFNRNCKKRKGKPKQSENYLKTQQIDNVRITNSSSMEQEIDEEKDQCNLFKTFKFDKQKSLNSSQVKPEINSETPPKSIFKQSSNENSRQTKQLNIMNLLSKGLSKKQSFEFSNFTPFQLHDAKKQEDHLGFLRLKSQFSQNRGFEQIKGLFDVQRGQNEFLLNSMGFNEMDFSLANQVMQIDLKRQRSSIFKH